MQDDSIRIKTPLFSLGIIKKESIAPLEEGKPIILRYWSWKKMGFIRKIVTLKKDGSVEVSVI